MLFSNNLVLLLIFFNLSFYIYSAEEQNYLNPSQRPQELVKIINDTFNTLACTSDSSWYMNGDNEYFLGNIDDKKLIAAITKNDKNNVYNFLDIGAGTFKWGLACARFISKLKEQGKMSQNTRINIVGVRGELNKNAYDKNSVEITEYTNNVFLYNVGCFKVEDLEDELKKYKLPTSFDLIVTRWTLRHLVDPVGVFVQACNILKSEGLFLGDGFFINYPNAAYESWAHENMETLLANLKMPFLIHPYRVLRSLNQFLLIRSKEQTEDPKLPLKYNEHNPMISINSYAYQSNGGTVVNFTPLQGWNSNPVTKEYDYTFYNDFVGKDVKGVYYGTEESQSLFDWIIENKLTDQKDDAV